MNVYMYRAEFYCEECGEKIKAGLGYSLEGLSEYEYDSDEYPKGPFPDGGGEADCPQHCDMCGLFLENPLTGDGYDYVKSALESASAYSNMEVLQEWAEFYERG